MLNRFSEVIGRLPLSRKLGLMAGLLIVPVVVLGAMFVASQHVQEEAYLRRLEGLRFLRPLVELQLKMAAHGQAAVLALTGMGGTSQVRQAGLEADQTLKAALAAQEASGNRFGTQALLSEAAESWSSTVKPNWNSSNPSLSADMHALLLAQIADVTRRVSRGASSEISAENGANGIDRSLVFSLPGSLERLARLGTFALVCARQGSPSQEQWDQLMGQTQEARGSVDDLRAELIRTEKMARADVPARNAARQAVAAADGLLEMVQDAAVRRDAFRADAGALRAQAAQATDTFRNLHSLLAGSLESELAASIERLRFERNLELFAVLTLTGLALLLGYLIAGAIRQQVQSLGGVFARIREGDLDARAEVVVRDEFGSFARSLNQVLDNSIALIQSREERDTIQANIHKLLEEMEVVAKGDLTKEADASGEATREIARAFNAMLVELRGLINRVQESTSAVNAAAARAEQATAHLATGSLSQAEQIVTVTTAVDQMNQSVRQVTSQAATAAHIAQAALKNAQAGVQSVRLTIGGMGDVRRQVQDMGSFVQELGESSLQIGEITQLIADISKRTSILALNASIQAAVAGEAGKGFAVVAEQVEELASRSSEAARRVATLNKSIQASTGRVNEALEGATRQVESGEEVALEASARLSEIERVSTQLAGVVESILASCRQQSVSSESIAKSMGGISDVTRYTGTSVESAANSIQELSSLVTQLRGSVARFRLPSGSRNDSSGFWTRSVSGTRALAE